MTIKRHCQFVLNKKNKDDEFAYIRYRVKWAGNTLAFSVGYSVTPEKWSVETQRCKVNSSHGSKRVPASIINRAINEMEEAMQAAFAYFELSEITPSKEDLKKEFLRRAGADIKTKSNVTLFEAFDIFVQTQSIENMWTKSTKEKLLQVKKDLYDFDRSITFNNLTSENLSNFIIFLRDDRELRNSTIKKKYAFLKWFLNWATSEGYNSNVAFKSYSPKLKDTQKPIVFLEWEELIHLYNLEDLPAYLEKVRDVFCFCCFTSLRYSDVANLRLSNISSNSILITTIKTNDFLKIELNKYSKAILKKYSSGDDTRDRLALPVISNQKMNNYLKELGKIAGLDTLITTTYYIGNKRYDKVQPKYELIGTHTGRRTFISNALMMGIPPEVVMKWTGHSDYKAMKPYIAIADKVKEQAMRLFDEK